MLIQLQGCLERQSIIQDTNLAVDKHVKTKNNYIFFKQALNFNVDIFYQHLIDHVILLDSYGTPDEKYANITLPI